MASGRRIDAERLAVLRLRYQALCEQAATFVHAWLDDAQRLPVEGLAEG